MKYTNKTGLPAPLVWALKQNEHHVPDGSFSVTELEQPARMRRLLRDHPDDVVVDVDRNIYSFIGTAVHHRLEGYPGGLSEKQFCADFNGTMICGTPDLVIPDQHVMYDWKVSSTWVHKYGVKPAWKKQANVYRWMLRENGIHIKYPRVTVLYRDFTDSKVGSPNYPSARAETFDVEIMPMDKVHGYIATRIAAHTAAEKELPLCNSYEMWEKWLVLFRGRCIRKFDKEGDMDEYLASGKMPERATVEWKRTRCESWCDARSVCSQYREFLSTTRGVGTSSGG